MKLDEYQLAALQTKYDVQENVFYYGLISESAGILAIHKKALRDNEAKEAWIQDLKEEIGDTLWYIAIIAKILDTSLSNCAVIKISSLGGGPRECSSLTFQELQDLSEELRTGKELDAETRQTSSMLGLISEAGYLMRQYQGFIRHKSKFDQELCIKYLGSMLWYLTDIATSFGLNLGEIAKTNKLKIEGQSRTTKDDLIILDEGYESDERFPRQFDIVFYDKEAKDGKHYSKMRYNNVFIGDRLDDNSDTDDGYRFHDAIHLAHVAILGWSPVIRALLNLKRKSNPETDRSQDGQRAIIIEEAIVAINFEYAKSRGFFKDNSHIFSPHLKIIKALTRNLEVSKRSTYAWKKAIVQGFKIYKKLEEKNGGVVRLDLDRKTIKYSGTLPLKDE